MKTKTLLFLDTSNISDIEIKTFLLSISKFKDLKTEISQFEIDRIRPSKPLLITLFKQKLESTDFWNYDNLANLGKEGYKIISVHTLEEYAEKLANEFKYY
jgi:hypothetical protein